MSYYIKIRHVFNHSDMLLVSISSVCFCNSRTQEPLDRFASNLIGKLSRTTVMFLAWLTDFKLCIGYRLLGLIS